jgi:Asp-tRNA(Asn)/Glu-tRNA(Gln) amidotransferase B subunit
VDTFIVNDDNDVPVQGNRVTTLEVAVVFKREQKMFSSCSFKFIEMM